MGRGWPNNRFAVAASDHEQAFPTGWRAEVAGLEDAPLDDVAKMLQLTDEGCPGLTAAFRIRHKELLVDRYDFARLGNGAPQLHYSAGRLAALGDQRPPLENLFTFSRLMTRGFFLPVHFRPIHDRFRISRLRGWPPAAWL